MQILGMECEDDSRWIGGDPPITYYFLEQISVLTGWNLQRRPRSEWT